MQSDKSTLRATRLVPIWYLFRFATPLDVFMMIVGSLMAIASGLALPGHMLMLGDTVDFFIAFDIANQLRTNMGNSSCEAFTMAFDTSAEGDFSSGSSLNGARSEEEHFCSVNGTSGLEDSSLPRYITSCNLGDTLQSDVTLYVYYYIAMASGLLITAFLAIALWNWAAYRQTRRMRTAFFKSILHQDIGWFDVNPSSELNTHLSDDIERIQAGIGDTAAIFLMYLSTVLSSFTIAFVTSWKMTLVVGTIVPLLAILSTVLVKITALFTVREQTAYASAGGVAEEVLSSIRTVVAFGGEAKEIERYKALLTKAETVGQKKGFLTSLISGLMYFITFSGYGLGFWYGATLIAECELLPGRVVTVFFAIAIGSFFLNYSLPELQTFAISLGSATAMFSVLDREPEIDVTSDDGDIPHRIDGDIELKDVIFSYPAKLDIPVLQGLDLKIKGGQTVALVGPSGCGKSTVVQLLQRFYNPSGGQILLDGNNIASLNLKWLRSNIGVVSQEPVLFDTTIAENIRYGKEGATLEEIEDAAKAANAYGFISELPNGFNTNVGERGTQLSGGQKQRIAIARALVRDPKILLLDEATSALDTESEKIVQEALDKAREGRTTIVIAHRLSTIQTADVIAGIEGGRVVEMGTHTELMDKGGLYYELVTAQTTQDNKEKDAMRDNSNALEAVDEADGPDILSGFVAALRHSKLRWSQRRDLCRNIFQRERPLVWYQRFPQSTKKVLTTLTFGLFHPNILNHLSVTTHMLPSASEHGGLTKDVEYEEATLLDSKDNHNITTIELLKLIQPNWCWVVLGVLASGIFGTLYPIISILFSGALKLFSELNRDALLQGASEYAGYFILMAVLAGILQLTGILTLSVAGERLTTRLRLQSFSAMLRQNIGWFDKKCNSTGALTSCLAVDASEVKGATGLRLGFLLQIVAGVIAALVIALEASWLLTIVLFCVFPLFFIVETAQIKLVQPQLNKNKLLVSESAKTANEAIDNIRTVASLGIEDKFYRIYQEQLQPPFISNMKSVASQAAVFAVSQAMVFYVYSAGLRLGAFQVASDPSSFFHVTYEEVFRVFAAVVFTALSIGSTTAYAPDIQKAHLSASRILALLNTKPNIDSYNNGGIEPDEAFGTVQLKYVSFKYPARPNIAVLQDMSIAVQPGETLALVGPSGCGKSTVVSLVERFYDVNDGSVEVDNENIRDLNIRWLRRQIGIVSQEPVLFDKSIADNIHYGANFREVSDEEIVEAAKAANIHNFIQSLPEGYNTNVGSKGTQLSGGQKQRIAIARALVRDPKILLLDEATSALDTESEKIVKEALDKAREGRTCIVIAHRLSTIYNSDCIAVIHNGNVLERGTHSELMAQKGAYYLLNTDQKEEGTNEASS